MSESKYNPNCKLAKEGKLPPKKRPMSKKQTKALVAAYFATQTGAGALIKAMGGRYQ